MKQELINAVQTASAGQPDWLQKKRQLAIMLAQRLPVDHWQQDIVDEWKKQPDLTITNEQVPSPEGYVDMPIFVAAQKYPELLQENLMEKAISWQSSQINALHLATLNGGRFIYVPNGTNVEKPIEIRAEYHHKNYHNLVIIGANAHATLVEHQSAKCAAPTFFGTEILLGDSAQIDYYQSNNFSAERNWQSVRAYQAGDSEFNLHCALFDRHNLYGDFYTNLDGDGSRANFKMVGIASHDQLQEIKTRIDNRGLHTDGEILQNGVVKDQAILNFHAVGKIYKGAHQSASNQESRLLTLTKESHGEADPVLLIEDNDVNAGHAASIGQVDPDQLYYLESRGLTLMQAQILLTKGFLLPVIEKFPDQKLRQQTIDELLERLEVNQ